jgi:O-antigen/teichoic acid export membrane protein
MSNFSLQAKSAVLWNVGFNLLRDGLQFLTMIILVRLLPNESYGQFSFVTSVIGFISIFAFNNFIAYSLQVKDSEEAQFQEHFTAGAFLNIGMCGITNIVALGLHFLPTWEPVAPLLHFMSLTFLLEWPCEVRRKMIEREFDWKTLRTLHAVGLFITAALALTMAWTGLGTYALIIPGMATTIPFIYDLFFRLHWRPTWEWSWTRYQPVVRFASARIGSGLLGQGQRLIESTTLATVLGFASLGILNRSFGLAQLFCGTVSAQLVYAIYPILTRVEEKEGNAARVSSLVIQSVAWITIPMAITFAVLSSPIIILIYGEKWLEVIPLVPWAMSWGVASALFHATYMLLLARQQQRKCLIADITLAVGTGFALLLALPHGIMMYLAASTITQTLALLVITFWLWQVKALDISGWIQALLPALIASIGSALPLSIVQQFWFSNLLSIPQIIAWVISFAAIYLILLRTLFRRQLTLLVMYLPGKAQIQKILFLAT